MERAELDAIVRAIIDRSELGILIRQLQASLPGLRVVRGTVSSAGAVLRGTDWSVARTGVGLYTVTFTTPFPEAPAILMTPESGGLPAAKVGLSSPTNFTAALWTTNTGALVDSSFHFLAIGPV